MICLQAIAIFSYGHLCVSTQAIPIRLLVTAAFFGLLTQGLCSVLNDITDLQADKINHPERPLPAGIVSVNQAWLVVFGCFIGSVLSGSILATSPTSYYLLTAHLICSLLYSFPRIRFGRHWLMGPVILASATVCGILFVLSATPLYELGLIGKRVMLLIGLVCFLQHLLVIPLKDLRDIKGDSSDNGSSLAMRFSLRRIIRLAIVGYLTPWLILYLGTWYLGASQEVEFIESVLRWLALAFGLIGTAISLVISAKPSLLLTSQRFVWFAELGVLFVFQLSLPLATLTLSQ